MRRDTVIVEVPGNWFTEPRRDVAGLKLTLPGGERFLGRSPGPLHLPRARWVQWKAVPAIEAPHVRTVRESALRDRIASIEVGRTVVAGELLAALSSFSPALRYLSFIQCRGDAGGTPLSSASLRMVAFNGTDPGVVGPLPHFLRSVFVADLERLPDSWLATVSAAFPENLFVHGPVGAGALAGVLAVSEIRRLEVTATIDADELLRGLSRLPDGAGFPARTFRVNGVLSGRVGALRQSLARRGIEMTVVRRRRGA